MPPSAKQTNGPPAASQATALAISSFDDTMPIVIDATDAPLTLTVDDVLKYIAPGAPRGEALMFLMTCRAAKLNPLLKEAFLVPFPRSNSWATVIAKAGYLRRAQTHLDYNGHESGIIGQAFDPKKQSRGPVEDFVGTFLPPGYIVLGGWAKVYRKGIDHAFTARISLSEYGKEGGLWKTLPCTLIAKTALVHALREAFGIGDSYDESESEVPVPPLREQLEPVKRGPMDESTDWTPTVTPTAVLAPPPDLVSTETGVRLRALMGRANMSDYQVNAALTKRGVDRVEDLAEVDAMTLINKIERTLGTAAGVDDLVERIQESKPAKAPRKREPGDDDELFDDTTGKVIEEAFAKIDAGHEEEEIDAELDRPIMEHTIAKDAAAEVNRLYGKKPRTTVTN